MTRFAKHKKEKKSAGENATPWEQLKETITDEGKRKEQKRLEKKRKRELKKVGDLEINKTKNEWFST